MLVKTRISIYSALCLIPFMCRDSGKPSFSDCSATVVLFLRFLPLNYLILAGFPYVITIINLIDSF